MKQRIGPIIAVSLLFLLLNAGIAACQQAKFESVCLDKKNQVQYEPCEIKICVPLKFENATDTREVEINAVIVTPDGASLTVPAFYSDKDSSWIVRYTPVMAGKFSFTVSLKTSKEAAVSEKSEFEVTGGKTDGFLRKGKNPYYPVFDSGKSFFGLGHNVAWAKENEVSDFESYFAEFQKNGLNAVRIWTNTNWALPIEDTKLGKYNLTNCDKLESVIKLAEKYGIYISLVLDSYGSLMDERGQWGEDAWKANPYNKKNGGPCEKPADFFTNEEAKRAYKNRVRYFVARYGYSPNILAFELWNEMDATPPWTEEMARYIKSINPHGQFVTTSLGYPWWNNFDESSIWKLDAIDIVQQHIYGGSIDKVISIDTALTKKYNKPVVVGEFGVSADRSDVNADPAGTGLALHDSIWAAAMSGSFCGAFNWWWDDYIRPKKLYPHYKALRNFLNDIDFSVPETSVLKISAALRGDREAGPVTYNDVSLRTKEEWGNISYTEFTISNNGELSGGSINGYLQGKKETKLKIDPVFQVNYPVDGKFLLHIGYVSQGGTLKIFLDDKEVFSKDFTAGPGEGPWIKSIFRPDLKVYQCFYDTDVGIDVPAGSHTIRLTNTGIDWIGIKNVKLTNYSSDRLANTRIAGIRVDKKMLVWIQNKGYTLERAQSGEKIPDITDASFDIEGVEGGDYTVEWWDTFKGKPVIKKQAVSANGRLTVPIPSFSADIACKINK